MKPIIFCRVASMKYYKGITDRDIPYGGGSYVRDTGMANECYNFATVEDGEGNQSCIGFVMLAGSKGLDAELHLENINGCSAMTNAESIDGAIVVFCATSPGSKTMRVVGFYKNATIYRHVQGEEFNIGDEIEFQNYSFEAAKKDCVLLPYKERHSNSKWYVPTSGKLESKFGFGRHNVWFANRTRKNPKLKAYLENMIESIENYDGENWIDEGVM